MEKEQENEPIMCREEIRSLNSWSELAHETLLRSSVRENAETSRKYSTDILKLSGHEEDSNSRYDQNGFTKTVIDEESDESDDDNIFCISDPANMDFGGELEYLPEGARNYTSLPNFSSLPLDSLEDNDLYNSNPWSSLPPNYKDIIQESPVSVCKECNKAFTKTCACQESKDSRDSGKSESQLKDLFKSKSPSKYIFKPKGINFQNRKHFRQSQTSPDFMHASDENDQSDKVKNKIMSVWNNVRYGWTLKTKTTFLCDTPIFVLGRCYHRRPEDEEPEPGEITHTPPSMQLFRQDFESRLWFTYRRDFPPLSSKKLTTDCGWGCMLRSGQMMLAEAFIFHFLGRDWRVYSQSREQETFYRHIIQWFGDSGSDQCPFSIHKLVELGKPYGKQAGDWYGPSSVSHIFRDALTKASMSQPVLKQLCIYVAQDCTVYKQDIYDLCTAKPRTLTSSGEDNYSTNTPESDNNPSQNSLCGDWNKSVIILIPVRLGGEEFNPIYSDCIKNLMAQDGCLGIIGGKPKHSLYFIGWQGDKLIYIDPHYCQDYVDVLKRDFKIQSYHCFTPRKISIGKMDPSGTLGFYCKSREDFDKLVEQTEQMIKPAKGGGPYPMFVFSEGRGSKLNVDDFDDLTVSEDRILRVRHVRVDENGRRVGTSFSESEEFIVL